MRVLDWIDARTGYRALLQRALDEQIEGGARWAYVLSSGVTALLAMQLVTGLLMLATYTPSTTDAWASVAYLQHQVTSGWFVRGLHHHGTDALVIVLGLYVLQVLVYGAYKKPRELSWWVVLGLFGMVQGAALTGYVLPWDQGGYWASNVRTNIAGSMPVVGPVLQSLVVGGSSYGQSTLTRFFALHVGVLPLLLGLLWYLHGALRRRHGVAVAEGARGLPAERYVERQLLRDLAFVVLVLGAVVLVTVVTGGAPLSAPVDQGRFFPARPEWFHRFLNQMIILLPPSLELVATAVLPGLATMFLLALPFLDRVPSRRVRERWVWLAPTALGLLIIGGLTGLSFHNDEHDPEYQEAVQRSAERAERAVWLAGQGVPPGGPLEMIRQDPVLHGGDLFDQHCTSCHVLDGRGEREAPDHTGFASRNWILGLLYDPHAPHYFGNTELDGMDSMQELGDEALRAVTEFLFSLGHEPDDPPFDQALAKRGHEVFEKRCMDCHEYEDDGDFLGMDGPDLTGYASRRWIRDQIAHPEADTQYGDINEMPGYADQLEAHDIAMLADFLRLQRFREPSVSPQPASDRDEAREGPREVPGPAAQR